MTPPFLPQPMESYSQSYFISLLKSMNLFFATLTAVRPWSVSSLNIDLATLPTEADVANLRTGDVYRDSTAGNVLKVKT